MLSVNEMNGGTWLFAVELREGAVMGTGRAMVAEAIGAVGLPCVIVDFGSLPPDDTGDRVAVADALMPRASRLAGARLGSISDSIGVYELLGA